MLKIFIIIYNLMLNLLNLIFLTKYFLLILILDFFKIKNFNNKNFQKIIKNIILLTNYYFSIFFNFFL